MRLLLLLPYEWDTGPSQRYRIEQWSPWLERAGIRCERATLLTAAEQRLLYSPASAGRKAAMLLGAAVRRVRQLSLLRHCDAVWIHRAAFPIGPAWIEARCAARRPTFFEFDDAIWIPHTAATNRRWRRLKWSDKTAAICRLARHVVVGNDFLADYARRFNPRVTVVPTTIDTDTYRPRADWSLHGPLVVGWTGSPTTLPHLRLLEEPLRRAAAAVPLKLRTIGIPGYQAAGVETESLPFRAEAQAAAVASFDLGLMPLPDEPWAAGKCACKALEYMATAVPCVSSPVGVNAHLIRDGESGLLAAGSAEWEAAILRLAAEAALRESLGRAGRGLVEAHYSAAAHAPRVAQLIRREVEAASS